MTTPTEATETLTYTCRGSVRGSCGHKHRTLRGAVRCLVRDRNGCSKHGGYSDRRIVPSDPDADTRELDDEIHGAIDRL